VSKIHTQNVAASFPGTVLGPRNFTVPLEHIGSAIVVLDRLGDEAEGVVAPPFLALLLQSVDDQVVGLFLLHS
jgi:hypothetical protein